ncbi:MAG: carbamoyltransferase HypF, partial [Gemmatimonadales bacterium]|nr:carbamoyltransferase HypF [Gemmatimonadales bacterium]
MIDAMDGHRAARRLRVTGLVQGVGFRPFVHRLAVRHHLDGWVRNGADDVEIALEGVDSGLDAFVEALTREAPRLAQIEAVEVRDAGIEGLECFTIQHSTAASDRRQPVSPDVALCAACEAELFDAADRRYRFPFITCTDCGPRITVIGDMPYDRERTSMAAFRPCPACRAEYDNPADRRYHSETNCCPACGPHLWVGTPERLRAEGTERALAEVAGLLRAGGILALRGLGGFHLAVDATAPGAVGRLRRRKHREAKPFAVMVRSLDEARRIAEVNEAAAAALVSPERPIVLLPRRGNGGLAPEVAPGLDQVGVLLAYTPLHHLILEAARRPLVMTSGNRSEEPIAMGNAEAIRRLTGVADTFLLHDREIVTRIDDSVVRIVGDRPVLLRRARGYAPLPLALPLAAPVPLVAVGAHLKSTFALAHGRKAYVSQHLGDLDSVETLEHWRATLAAYRHLFRIRPEVAVCDLHAGYLSTRVAREFGLDRTIVVQHHHAHIAAVLAEHGETGPVLGVAFDGTGAGDDGTVWGGEFLVADLVGYRRVGHLLPAPLPGGDLAARTPWRAALGYLSVEPGFRDAFATAFTGVDHSELAVAERQIDRRVNAPLASSAGRLFDAAAAVIGLRRAASYEGQAAMELEALAARRPATEYPSRLVESGERLILDPLPLLAVLGARACRG